MLCGRRSAKVERLCAARQPLTLLCKRASGRFRYPLSEAVFQTTAIEWRDFHMASNDTGFRPAIRPSMRTVLFAVIVILTGAALAVWGLRPTPIDVRVSVEPYSLSRYDDHRTMWQWYPSLLRDGDVGRLPMGAWVRVTNASTQTIWYLGFPGIPVVDTQQLVDGDWDSSISATSAKPVDDLVPAQWAALRSGEFITFMAGPVSGNATEIRVGVPFTSEWWPADAHWIYSPIVRIVKNGTEHYPDVKQGADQEEQVVSLKAMPSR